MNLRYIALLSILTLKNAHCYSANRQPRLTTIKNANPKPQELVIPARYKVKNTKSNYDSSMPENVQMDDFPEVEYPSSVVESSKPFYINVNPFSNDVKSSFKSLAPGTAKKTPTIVVNVKPKEKLTEKNNTNTSQLPKVTNETAVEQNDTKDLTATIPENDYQYMDKHLTNWSSIELAESDEMEYVVQLIDDLDEFLTNITDIETEIIDLSNSTQPEFDSDRPTECATITSDVTSENNDTVAELNQGTTHNEPPSPVFVKPEEFSSNITSIPNEANSTIFYTETSDDLPIDNLDENNDSS